MADAKARWIKKHGEKKSVKEWLEAHPPPADFEGTPQDYAFAEMEEEPIDDPIEPDYDEFPQEGKFVTRAEHDALRAQVASSTRKVRNAIKRARRSDPPPPPPPTLGPPSPKRATGLAAILAPLARRK